MNWYEPRIIEHKGRRMVEQMRYSIEADLYRIVWGLLPDNPEENLSQIAFHVPGVKGQAAALAEMDRLRPEMLDKLLEFDSQS